MIILGVDPGIATVGYGVIKYNNAKTLAATYMPGAYGSITTEAGTAIAQRLKKIYDELSELIKKYRPDAFAVEELFFNTNTKTALTVSQARGVIILAAENAGIKTYEYTPLQVKQALTGYGRADKQQMQQMIKILLGLEEIPRPDDVADALAIAICHANQR